MIETNSEKNKTLAGVGLMSAIIVDLTIIATFVKFGPFSITLALVPIVVGSAIFGSAYGALFGGVFGLVALIMSIFGFDVGGSILWNVNPLMTEFVCLAKGAAAGFVSGLFYSIVSKKNMFVGIVGAAVICPIVNTGVFVLFMVLFYHETLVEWAAGQDTLYYIVFGLVGVNFLLELIINIIFSPIIKRIINIKKVI